MSVTRDDICDLFIRSYRKDLDWLEFCLAAVCKFARGFRSVIVVVPRSSIPWLKRTRIPRESVRIEVCSDYADDYLGQQATKLYADRFSDADFICHLDSDCILADRTTPQHLMVGSKPVIITCRGDHLDRHWPWRGPTEAFLGTQVTHDYMQRPPFVFPRWIYPEVREHCQSVHGTTLEEYVLSRPPRGFSEFNALGAWARCRHPDDFVWVEDRGNQAVEQICRWYWSWGGLDRRTRREIEDLLRGCGEVTR